METAEIVLGRWYPLNAPRLPGETPDAYTNRLTGADRTGRRPYDHSRNRQCSIGYHNECSDRDHSQCGCPCHDERRDADRLAAEFNQRVKVSTVVNFIEGCDEPPVATTSKAYVGDDGWPVVDLDTFPNPVWLSWLKPTA